MKRIFSTLLSASLLCAPALATEGLPRFDYSGLSALRASAKTSPGAPAPAGRAADVVTKSHLLARAGREVLLGHADSAEQAAEAGAHWSAALRSAGVTPGALRYENGLWTLAYSAPAGKALRSFLADPKQFPPKDEAGLRANMALVRQALAAAGLPVVSAQVLDLEYLLPTYSLIYITEAAADPAKETQLRLLNARDESDFAVFDGFVRVVQVPKPWLMVYVGPQAGVVHMGARDEASARKKLSERRAFLTGQGHSVVAERLTPLQDADIKFVASLYFLY